MEETPADVWSKAASLGQVCRKQGISTDSLDLLIASVALHHEATVVTFDDDFVRIATVSDLQVTDARDPKPRSREVFSFHRPETRRIWRRTSSKTSRPV